jgi:hypothetical protein
VGIFAWLKALFGFGQAVSEEIKQRDAELNTPQIQANAAAATEAAAKAQAAKDVANPNVTDLEKDIS